MALGAGRQASGHGWRGLRDSLGAANLESGFQEKGRQWEGERKKEVVQMKQTSLLVALVGDFGMGANKRNPALGPNTRHEFTKPARPVSVFARSGSSFSSLSHSHLSHELANDHKQSILRPVGRPLSLVTMKLIRGQDIHCQLWARSPGGAPVPGAIKLQRKTLSSSTSWWQRRWWRRRRRQCATCGFNHSTSFQLLTRCWAQMEQFVE